MTMIAYLILIVNFIKKQPHCEITQRGCEEGNVLPAGGENVYEGVPAYASVCWK